MEASAHCHVSLYLKSPSSLSTVDKGEEVQPASDLDNEHVVKMNIRCEDTKATPEKKKFFLFTSPNEETVDNDESHYSVNSCFSHFSNEMELLWNCCPHEEEDELPCLSSNDRHKLIPSLIKETSANCLVSSFLKFPSSLSSVDEEEEAKHDSDLDSDNVVIMRNRSRATNARAKQKDYFFLTSPNEETDDESQVFDPVKSCLSHLLE